MVGESTKKLRFKRGDKVVVIGMRQVSDYPSSRHLNKVGTVIQVRLSPAAFDYKLSFGENDTDACDDHLLELADNQIFNDIIDKYYEAN